MHAYGYHAPRFALTLLVASGVTHAARADDHMVFDLDPTMVYEVIADGSTLHGNLQPGPLGFVSFDAPSGAQLQVVATGQGDVTPPAAITDLAASPAGSGEAALTWTAPGDDGSSGQASFYEILWATSAAGLTTSPNLAAGAPAPSPAGGSDAHTVTGLPAGTIYFDVRARDEAGNRGGASNLASAVVTGGSGSGGDDDDTTPPAPIEDFAARRAFAHGVALGWTATGDDGATGQAEAYELRYSTDPIDQLSFPGATPFPGPDPGTPGTTEELEVTGLEPGTRYYFAIRAEDDAGNVSALSPTILVLTRGRDGAPIPPGNAHGWMSQGRINIEWDPSPDPAIVGYHVYRRPDGEPEESSATTELVSGVTFIDESFEEGQGYTYRITSVDDLGAESTQSASTWLRAAESVPAAAVIEKMYPNPVRGAVDVTFRIGIPEVGPGNPDGGRVTVDLYDVAGHRVARVFDDYVRPGVREVRWQPKASGRAFVPGMYVALVNASGSSATDRLVIAR